MIEADVALFLPKVRQWSISFFYIDGFQLMMWFYVFRNPPKHDIAVQLHPDPPFNRKTLLMIGKLLEDIAACLHAVQ